MRGEKNGNATRVYSYCGPISHMKGTEVSTSIYLLCHPLRIGKEKKGVFDDFFYKSVLYDGWVLKYSDDNEGVSFNGEIFELK